MKTWIKVEVPQWLLLGAMFGAAALFWGRAPERIPVHWNFQGQVDRFGGKFEGLLLLPLIALGVYLLLLLAPRIDPGRANYARFQGAYTAIRIAILALLALIDVGIYAAIFKVPHAMGHLLNFGIGALFIVIGGVLGKVRPNWFVGIRTPWTLSSKQSWTRTHRAGGWVFLASGLATILAACISERVGLVVMLASVGVGCLGLVIYSYLVWRQDPDKLPAAGTRPAD